MSIFDRFIVVGHFKRKPVDQTVNNVPAVNQTVNNVPAVDQTVNNVPVVS